MEIWRAPGPRSKTARDVDVPDEYGNTLLMHTAVFGKTADVEFLLAHGAKVNAANQAGPYSAKESHAGFNEDQTLGRARRQYQCPYG